MSNNMLYTVPLIGGELDVDTAQDVKQTRELFS